MPIIFFLKAIYFLITYVAATTLFAKTTPKLHVSAFFQGSYQFLNHNGNRNTPSLTEEFPTTLAFQ